MNKQITLQEQPEVWEYLRELEPIPSEGLVMGVCLDGFSALWNIRSTNLYIENGRDVLKTMVSAIIHRDFDSERYFIFTPDANNWNNNNSSDNLDIIEQALETMVNSIQKGHLTKMVFLFVEDLEFFLENLSRPAKICLEYLAHAKRMGVHMVVSGSLRNPFWTSKFTTVWNHNGIFRFREDSKDIYFVPLICDI